MAKLYFNWKFDKVAKIKSLSSFLAFKVSSSFPANQRPLTHLSLAIGPVWHISLDVEDVSVFYGYTGKCTIDHDQLERTLCLKNVMNGDSLVGLICIR